MMRVIIFGASGMVGQGALFQKKSAKRDLSIITTTIKN